MSAVTLVITTLNEEESISKWLDSVNDLIAAPEEMVVCDGGSSDRTVELIERWASTSKIPTRLVIAPGANISRGRNIAIESATHETIAVTDAGTQLDNLWLHELRAAAEHHEVVAGFFYPVGVTVFERLLATSITFREEEIREESFLPSSRSLLITKKAWRDAGRYPEWLDYCEDLIFDLELKRVGYVIGFQPKALVSWSARPHISGFFKQYYRYGRGDGKARLFAKRHAVRYLIYASALAIAVTSAVAAPSLLQLAGLALLIGVVLYSWRYINRLRKSNLPVLEKLAGFALAPVLAIVGDLAKMLGYPVGLIWRAQRDRKILSPQGG